MRGWTGFEGEEPTPEVLRLFRVAAWVKTVFWSLVVVGAIIAAGMIAGGPGT